MLPLTDYIPTRRTPKMTITLIVLNILVFLYELAHGGSQEVITNLGLLPSMASTHPLALETWRHVLTSMFTHGGFAHIAFNMLYLWIFGNNVEDMMGSFKFLIFYLLTGALAAATHIFMDPSSQVPMVGASGAIAGVLGAYIVLYPRARVKTLIFLGAFARIADLSALWVLGLWFILQLMSGITSIGNLAAGGVAFWAHIGGFVAGVVLVKLFAKTPKRNY